MSSTGPERDPYTRPADPAGAPSSASPWPHPGDGRPNSPGGSPAWPAPQPSNGLAVASLVLGICGILLSWFTFGLLSILAVIFGHVALGKVKQGTASGRELAIAGLVTGYVIIAIWLLLVILGTLAFMSFSAV